MIATDDPYVVLLLFISLTGTLSTGIRIDNRECEWLAAERSSPATSKVLKFGWFLVIPNFIMFTHKPGVQSPLILLAYVAPSYLCSFEFIVFGYSCVGS